MALISRKICHLSGVSNENLNGIVGELKAFLEEQQLPEDCIVDVYKDVTACCGYFAMGVAVEIQAPGKLSLDELNLKLTKKFREIIGRHNIEDHCDYDFTSCDPVEIV
jgi:hypothetical protein